ncbi:MAG TPA: metallophosphoesterase, partial [Ignavibacteriaceae bacterium]
MKIAHISDLHLNCESNTSTYSQIKSVLKYISKNRFDHLVITGDISDNSSSKDFLVLRNLLARYGFLQWDKLSIVIGNHDIFGGIQNADDLLNFSKKFNQIDYDKKVEEFISYFLEAFENCVYISEKQSFPYAKKIKNSLLIGLNSNSRYSPLSNPFASNGEISSSQFAELLEILKIKDSEISHRIILIHHHFNKLKAESQSSIGKIWQNIEKQTMKLKNKKRLFRLFTEYKIDLVLHGHIHQSKEYL